MDVITPLVLSLFCIAGGFIILIGIRALRLKQAGALLLKLQPQTKHALLLGVAAFVCLFLSFLLLFNRPRFFAAAGEAVRFLLCLAMFVLAVYLVGRAYGFLPDMVCGRGLLLRGRLLEWRFIHAYSRQSENQLLLQVEHPASGQSSSELILHAPAQAAQLDALLQQYIPSA